MGVTVVIPTVAGRESYLARAVTAYLERTPVTVQLVILNDRPTCGIAWQEGSELADQEYLHFTADDILPDHGWFEAMVAVVERGGVPCGLVRVPGDETLDENDWPVEGRPIALEQFFERESTRQIVPDGYEAHGESEYPAVPFCSMQQWQAIVPMIPSHYATDKWFGHRARAAGFGCFATHAARFWHYAARAGRVPQYEGDAAWTHTDRLDFDLVIAWRMYVDGQLNPRQQHPEWNTPAGRELARAWRRAHQSAPFPWDDPDLGPEYR